jgi:D-beta-D-heptose 7-phosphate kinase / D-beta-D-heptose 1-phosphate adenosyltransferase
VKPQPAMFASPEEAAQLARRTQAAGGVVVFTSGAFDLLHPGHTRHLTAAKRQGTLLIVGLDSDRSVRLSTGPDRPVNSARERAEILLALDSVDAVVVVDDETPEQLIHVLQPDIRVNALDDEGDRALIERVRALGPPADVGQ